MTEKEIEYTKTTEIRTFKARIKASKPHFVQKVMVHKTKVDDALYAHFRSYITIFVPKLKPSQRKPVCMLHIANGGGQCLIRCESPVVLADILRELASEITSDSWLEKWDELGSISDKVIMGNVLLDEDFVDVGDFKKLAGIKKSESGLPALEVE
jgi:hypothetical protein